IEELGVVDSGIGLTVAAHNSLCTGHIYLAGGEEQKKKWLPKLTSGEWIGAWGLTEPGSGSDAAGMRTTAVKDGNDWILNGTKNFITNASHADISVVIAVTDRNDQKRGMTAFAIEMDRKGIHPGKKENKLGMRASDTAELVMEDCRLPASSVLGKIGDGEAVRVGGGGALHGKRSADFRRLRLHQRFPGRKVLPRREAVHHRRRHFGNSEDGNREASFVRGMRGRGMRDELAEGVRAG